MEKYPYFCRSLFEKTTKDNRHLIRQQKQLWKLKKLEEVKKLKPNVLRQQNIVSVVKIKQVRCQSCLKEGPDAGA